MRFYQLAFLLIFPFSVFAQNTIVGSIKNQLGSPLRFATVTLKQYGNILRQAQSDNSGKFTFSNVINGNYHLIAKYTGFKTIDSAIRVDKTCEFRLKLTDSINQLSIVTVRSRIPAFEKKTDRIVYDISNNPSYTNKSMADILSMIPRLNVTKNGIEIKGLGLAAVMIDDHLIYLSGKDLLEYLNVIKNDISKVDIITNPPAKYDAQGSGLVNIVTKKGKSYGLFGYLESSVTKNSFWEGDQSLSLNFRNKNITLISSLGKSIGSYRETTSSDRFYPTSVSNEWIDNAANQNQFNNQRANFGVDILLNTKTKIFAQYSYVASKNDADQTHKIEYLNSERIDSTGLTTGLNKDRSESHILTAGINSKYGTDGTLDFTVDYIRKNNLQDTHNVTSDFYQQTNVPTPEVLSLTSTAEIPKNVFTTKLDLTLPKFYKNIKMETGIKYANFNNTSNTSYDELINGTSVYNTLITENHFIYNEQNFGGYYSFAGDHKQFSYKAGLRYEYTTIIGSSLTDRISNHYGNFFPSTFLQYKFSKGSSSIDVGYSRRIVRPTLYDLNPFRFYTSRFTYYQGNPFLSSSYQNNLTLNLSLKGEFLISLYHISTENPINSFPYQDGNDVYTIKQNNGKLYSYGMNADFYLNPKPWWQSSFGFNAGAISYRTNYVYIDSNIPLNISFSSSQSFTMPGNMAIDTRFSASFRQKYGVSVQKGYSTLDLGITKTLHNSRFLLSIRGQDLLRTNIQAAIIDNASLRIKNSNYYDFRQVSLTVRYKIGKELQLTRRRNNQEINRIR